LVVEVGDSPVGLIQYCPAHEYDHWPAALGLEDTVVVDGFVGNTAFLHQGVATAALNQVIEIVFATRPEMGVSAATHVENGETRSLLERCGFALVVEGLLPDDDLPRHAIYARWREDH